MSGEKSQFLAFYIYGTNLPFPLGPWPHSQRGEKELGAGGCSTNNIYYTF